MTATRIGTFEPGTPRWHAARRGRLGASEIAAVLGLSPWESHFSLWHRKAGHVEPFDGDELTSWGHYLEPAIAQRFADEHPEIRLRRTGTWVSRSRPWQLANPDRLAAPGGIPVEIKWAPYSDGWGATGTDEVPVYYRCQVLQQLDVLGKSHGYVAALVGSEYREYRIDYDPADVEVIRKAGADFMDSLEAGAPPDIDATGHTFRVLKEIHPDIDDREVEIAPDLADEFRTALADAKTAAAAERLAKNRLLDVMGTARRAVTPDGERVALRKPHGKGVALVETKPPKQSPSTIKETTTA